MDTLSGRIPVVILGIEFGAIIGEVVVLGVKLGFMTMFGAKIGNL